MRLSTVLPSLSDDNLRLVAQAGVTDLVVRYPGPRLEDLLAVRSRVEAFDLRLGVIEGYLPIERIKIGRDADGSELRALCDLVRHMGEAEVPVLCYNFMAGTDWVRTSLREKERGGALVTAFDRARVDESISLSHDSASSEGLGRAEVSADDLWSRLETMLQTLVPVAESAGVSLAMHPDDPPLPELLGRQRILHNVEGFERLVALAPSPANGICFCQGSFAAMGVDIPATIRRLGPHIRFVHFRDVRGTADRFVETFHDNGPTDMVAAMRAYREVGFSGSIRPDHVPQLVGEEDGEAGYTLFGRLHAFGYIRGLLQATET